MTQHLDAAGKRWRKFCNRAAFHGRIRREVGEFLESGVSPSHAVRRLRDKYGSRVLSGGAGGFTTLTGSMGTTFNWNAQVALQGVAYNPTTNSSSIVNRQPYGTAATNTQANGCDEAYSFQQGIVAGGSASLDLTAMTDLLQRVVALVRAKGYQFRVLSAADDPTINNPPPTATSIGCVSNGPLATPSQLDFGNGGSGLTVALTGSGAVTAVAIGAAGTGYPPSTCFLATPVQAGGSNCQFAVVTNSSGVPTSVVFITGAGGAGYTAATVPTVVVGQYTIYTGGAHAYFDPAPNGFLAVSSTQKLVKLTNTDASNAITFEVDVFGCTS